MELSFLINGVTLQPGVSATGDSLRRAGLARVNIWQRLIRRLPASFGYWEASDPHVECFGGEVSIYPCRHGYLDQDRRWGTSCLVWTDGTDISGIEVRVLDGVYAASNLFDRFTDAVQERFGAPHHATDAAIRWSRDGVQVRAEYQQREHNAVFCVDLV